MQYSEITVSTTHEGVENLCAALYGAGVNGLSIEDPYDIEEFISTSAGWDYIDEKLLGNKNGEVFVKVYVPENPQGAEILSNIKSAVENLRRLDCGLDMGSLEIGVKSLSEQDWANSWKQYYKPFEVGKNIIIKPQWEEVEQTGKTVVQIDPGMAFGTGMHHSTQLCLRALEQYAPRCERMLDLGCGSGILAIAALLLGAGRAVGIDIDEGAVRIASENAKLNGLAAPRFNALTANLLEDDELVRNLGSFDVIAQNIVADVIIALAPVSKRLLAPKGVLIASGIITERLNDVTSSLSGLGFTLLNTDEQQGWSLAVFSL